MSNAVNLNPIKGLNDAREIFLDFCKKVSEGAINWTSSDFNAYMDVIKQEVDNAYKRGYKMGEGFFRDSCLNLVNELHNVISNSLLTKMGTASAEELDKFIDGLKTSFELKAGYLTDDSRYMYFGGYGAAQLFDFQNILSRTYIAFYDYKESLKNLKENFISSINVSSKDSEVSRFISGTNDFDFLEKLYREELSKIYLVKRVRSKIPKIKEEYEKIIGHEVSKIDAIEMAVISSIFPERFKKFDFLNRADTEISFGSYNKEEKNGDFDSKKTFADSGRSIYHFLHEVIEVLEGEREEQLFRKSRAHISPRYKEDFKEFIKELNRELKFFNISFPDEFMAPSQNLDSLKNELKEEMDKLEKLKKEPIDIKRQQLINYVKSVWNSLEYETSEEYVKQYGFINGGPYSYYKSIMYWGIPKNYTYLLSNELEILSTMRVGDDVLKTEIKNISDTYSKGIGK